VPRDADITAAESDLLAVGATADIRLPGGCDIQALAQTGTGGAARMVRRRAPVSATVRLSAEPAGPASSAGRLLRLRVRVENAVRDLDPETDREVALSRALLATHTLLAAPGASFVSLIDPPSWAAPAARGCRNVHTFPVLAGPGASVVLSSPIILYDYPQVAPESPGGMHDATEIDEILSLRTLTLTEQEKAEARATDPRAAAIVDRVDSMTAEAFARLHGAIRSRKPAPHADDP
jgi:hypothetical protein